MTLDGLHLHQLAHTHNLKLFDQIIDPTGLPPAVRKSLDAAGR